MHPGRFVSLWFLVFGALELLRALVGYVLVTDFRVTDEVLLPATFGLILSLIGTQRLLSDSERERPTEYGYWAHAAVLVLLTYAVGLVYYAVTLAL